MLGVAGVRAQSLGVSSARMREGCLNVLPEKSRPVKTKLALFSIGGRGHLVSAKLTHHGHRSSYRSNLTFPGQAHERH